MSWVRVEGHISVGRWALIVLVLLHTGEFRVYDGFTDITDEYFEASTDEAPDLYQEGTDAAQPGAPDEGIPEAPEALR